VSTRRKKLSQPLPLGLALIAGGGFILMASALALGAIQGEEANTAAVTGAFVFGVALFFFGLIAWLVSVRPWEHFDDINVPMDTGHHGHASHDEHAITVTEPAHVEPHAQTHP
jgi:hypothetical protein